MFLFEIVKKIFFYFDETNKDGVLNCKAINVIFNRFDEDKKQFFLAKTKIYM